MKDKGRDYFLSGDIIDISKDDYFGHHDIGYKIFEKIIQSMDLKNKRSRIFALTGAWSYGKSSTIDYIVKELKLKKFQSDSNLEEKLVEEAQCNIIELDLSFCETSNQVVYKFFDSLADVIKDYNQKQAFRVYASKMLGVIPTIGTALSEIQKLNNEALHGSTDVQILDITQNKIIENLVKYQKENGPIFVVIDDIDRYGINTVQDLFDLLRVTRKFPIVFLLAFDWNYVNKALKERFVDGKNAIEKGIDYLYVLPKPSEHRLLSYFINYSGLRGEQRTIDIYNIEKILSTIVFPLFKNDIRLVNRSLRTQEISYDYRSSIIDIFQDVYPEIYSKLSELASSLVYTESDSIDKESLSSMKIFWELKKIIAQEEASIRECLNSCLAVLFFSHLSTLEEIETIRIEKAQFLSPRDLDDEIANSCLTNFLGNYQEKEFDIYNLYKSFWSNPKMGSENILSCVRGSKVPLQHTPPELYNSLTRLSNYPRLLPYERTDAIIKGLDRIIRYTKEKEKEKYFHYYFQKNLLDFYENLAYRYMTLANENSSIIPNMIIHHDNISLSALSYWLLSLQQAIAKFYNQAETKHAAGLFANKLFDHLNSSSIESLLKEPDLYTIFMACFFYSEENTKEIMEVKFDNNFDIIYKLFVDGLYQTKFDSIFDAKDEQNSQKLASLELANSRFNPSIFLRNSKEKENFALFLELKKSSADNLSFRENAIIKYLLFNYQYNDKVFLNN